MSLIGRKVRIFGRVQGVFFRQWAVHQARELDVAGWIRNLRDGSVEAFVTGDAEAVATMVERLRHGPNGARVEDLTTEDAPAEELDGFSVRI